MGLARKGASGAVKPSLCNTPCSRLMINSSLLFCLADGMIRIQMILQEQTVEKEKMSIIWKEKRVPATYLFSLMARVPNTDHS